MPTDTTSTRTTRRHLRRPHVPANDHPSQTVVHGGRGTNTRVLRRLPAPALLGGLGTAPIQKPPTGNFYCAGEFCPQVDAGKTTRNSAGRTLIGRYDNGLRWKYA